MRWLPAICALVICAAGVSLYGYAIHLPYRIDDFVHFRLLTTHTLGDVWAGTSGLAYYRPLPFTLWKIVYWLSGGYPPEIVNGINVVCHIANGLLLCLLVYNHQGRSQRALVIATSCALLFLMYPFSYQAVPWAGSLTHPLVTLLMLGGIMVAIKAHVHRSRVLSIIAIVLAILAPFAHETGVLLAAGLTLYYVTSTGPIRWREIVARTWPFWVCALLAGMALLLLQIHAGSPDTTLGLESRWQNGVYFLQGFMYPVAPLAIRLMALFPGLNDLGSILIVCLPVLLVLVYVFAKLGHVRMMLLAILWFAVMIAPAWLLLGFSYVIDGPRLMYEASAGAALFWTIPLSIVLERWDHIRQPIWRIPLLALSAAVVIGTMVGSLGFLNERADMYEETRLASQGLLAGAIPPSDDKRILLSLNFPGWLAPKEPTFALGHEGVSFIPTYSSPIDLIWTMTGQERYVLNLVVTELQSHWRFNYRNFGDERLSPDLQPDLRNARKIFFTSYRGFDLATYDAGNLELENQPRAEKYVAAYNNQLALLSGEWHMDAATMQVTLHWQSWLTLTQEVRTFVHLQNATGDMIAQEDGLPLMGLSNPLWWKPGDEWRDTRIVILPGALKPGRYFLRIGVYAAADGKRFSTVDMASQRLENDSATLGVIDIP
jgi:hypothetical protein